MSFRKNREKNFFLSIYNEYLIKLIIYKVFKLKLDDDDEDDDDEQDNEDNLV